MMKVRRECRDACQGYDAWLVQGLQAAACGMNIRMLTPTASSKYLALPMLDSVYMTQQNRTARRVRNH